MTNDPNDAPDELPDGLAEAFTPGTPLGRALEGFLDATGGPVPVDDAAIRRAGASLEARIAARTGRRRPVVWTAGTVAALAMAAAFLLWPRPAPEPDPVPEVVPLADVAGVTAGAEVDAVAVDGVVRLQRGAVRVASGGDASGVRLERLGLELRPRGTVWLAGARDDVGAVGVLEGEVAVVDQGAELAVLAPGEWALVGPDRVVRRFGETAPPSLEGLGEDDVADARQLVAELRWLALPAETRAAAGGGR